MFGSEILDVAIGLILIFLLLSLVCSSIKEAIETAFKHRAKDLDLGIREIFCDRDAKTLVPQFYQHPLINALFLGDYDANSHKNLPSYIPSRTFAIALMDIVKTLAEKKSLTEGSSSSSSEAGKSELLNAAPTSMDDFKSALAMLDEKSTIRRALTPLVGSAGTDLLRARQNIEDWYNASMDRVSGWYKKRTQIIIAATGFTLAALMNVDAIGIARFLDTNQTARSVIVAQVRSHVASPAAVPASSNGTAGEPSGSATPAPVQFSGPSTLELADPLRWLQREGTLPVGWRFKQDPGEERADYLRDMRRSPETAGEWFVKIAGILLTGFAVSLGAPFWFDLLNRFMVIRSTVKPDEKSPDEKSKA